jgi:hypothetical protein
MADTPISFILAGGVSEDSAREAAARVKDMNDRNLKEMLQQRESYKRDMVRYYADDAEVASRYQSESVDAQLKALARLANERKAFSEDAKRLAENAGRAIADGIDLEIALGKKGLQEYRNVLIARKALDDEYLNGLEQKRKLAADHEAALKEDKHKQDEAAAKSIAQRQHVVASVSSLAAPLARGIPDSPGNEAVKAIGPGIAAIASSKTIWEGLLNTTKMILDVGMNMYADSKRRTTEQIQVAGGSQQFARYYQDRGKFEAARHVQLALETDTSYTPQERKQIPQVLGSLQRGAQGKFDVSSFDAAKAALDKIAVVATEVGVSWSEMSGTIGDSARRTNRSVEEVTAAYARASNAVDQYNTANEREQISKKGFLEAMTQITQAMREHRFTEEDATAVTAKWAVALDRGTISVGEIIQQMKGFNAPDIGALAYLAPRIRDNIRKRAVDVLGKEQGEKFINVVDREKTAYGLANTLKFAGQNSEEFAKRAGLDTSPENRKKMALLLQETSNTAIREGTAQVVGNRGSLGTQLGMFESVAKIFARGKGTNLEGKGLDVITESLRGGGEALKKGEGVSFVKPGGAPPTTTREQTAADVHKMEGYLKQIRDKQIGWIDRQTAAVAKGTGRVGEVIEHRGVGAAAAMLGARALDKASAKFEGRQTVTGGIGPREAHYLQGLGYSDKAGFGSGGDGKILVDGKVTITSDTEAFKEAIPHIKKAVDGMIIQDQQKKWVEILEQARTANAGLWNLLSK